MAAFYASTNRIEVYHLRNLLEAAGIPCYLRNEALSQLAGEVPFPECSMEIWLKSDDDQPHADAVLKLLRDGPAPDHPGAPAWHCHCGEHLEAQFTACWRCGSTRPQSSATL